MIIFLSGVHIPYFFFFSFFPAPIVSFLTVYYSGETVNKLAEHLTEEARNSFFLGLDMERKGLYSSASIWCKDNIGLGLEGGVLLAHESLENEARRGSRKMEGKKSFEYSIQLYSKLDNSLGF